MLSQNTSIAPQVVCEVDCSDRQSWSVLFSLLVVSAVSILCAPAQTQGVALDQASVLPFILATATSLIGFRNIWLSFGKDIGMCELAAAMAVLQWLVAPMFSYIFEVDHYKYHMYVSSSEYFAFAVPGTALFIAGMMLPLALAGDRRGQRLSVLEVPPSLCWMFLGIGIAGSLLPSFVSVGPFGFVFYILANLKFAAALMFMFGRGTFKWLIPVVVLMSTGITARNSGMFHDAILWAAMLGIYFFLQRPNRNVEKVTLIAAGFMLALTIQVVKTEIRDSVWNNGTSVSFSQVAYDEIITNASLTDEEELEGVIIRFNQGWIISRILIHVPFREPYANGTTFTQAIESALVPRFLAPNKQGAGGAEMVTQFTGLEIGKHTSMGISLLGESYCNFGLLGGVGLMFVFGVGFRYAVLYSYRIMATFPLAFYFLPTVFLHAVKAETDSVTVFNFVTKSALLCVVIIFVMSQLTGHRRKRF